ncbi:hypothetical protein Alvin_0896 [Allochromatium vinosum DSM 180]|uniref:Uncharacterized protein n=1 Tax=Allochromatium vinosum (strain ATCC 17899 / DSM 180 / NBRC 103801 / NCIMB 10441 / D) TaxID=572477 RepID=D3RR14_ALLVD|nr:hypothetical protein Alvin_0896 [Allochromatium vinosum DSM 180]
MFFDPAALLPSANSANPANPAPQPVIANTITAPAISRFAGLAGESAADGALTISRFAELAATTAANDDPDRHSRWIVRHPDGRRESIWYDPPKTAAEVIAIYPGAEIEREPDPGPAPSLPPDVLEVVYAYLRAVGETDLAAGQAFIEAVARDPEQLRGLYEDVVKMGLADWPDDQATEPDSGIEITAQAVCARCAHWTPDRINPPGGLGHCTIAAPASKRPGSLWPWPDAEIHCTRFQEITPC